MDASVEIAFALRRRISGLANASGRSRSYERLDVTTSMGTGRLRCVLELSFSFSPRRSYHS